MRKIEKNMVAAIMARKRHWSGGNTTVDFIALGSHGFYEVKLHGNLIGQIHLGEDCLNVTFAGWPTDVTRSRVNALVRTFARRDQGFSISKGAVFFHNRDKGATELENSYGWVSLPMAGEFNAEQRALTKRRRMIEAASLEEHIGDVEAGRVEAQGSSIYNEG